MLKKNRRSLNFLWLVFFFSCNRNEPDCPTTQEFTVNTSVSHPCLPTGAVKVDAAGKSGFYFRLNKGEFQTDAVFENVPTGKHQIFMVDNVGCEFSKPITVDTISIGIKFKVAASILRQNCSQCHSGVNPHAGLDFTSVCVILNHWQRIEARAVVGDPSPMPPGGLISLAERNKILDWLNAGHGYEN